MRARWCSSSARRAAKPWRCRATSATEAFCQRLVADAVRELGGLDILVSNAARQHSHASIAELTSEQFDWTFKTNVYAMFWITKAAMPHLGAGSSIINTASVQAYDPVGEPARLRADQGRDRRLHQSRWRSRSPSRAFA